MKSGVPQPRLYDIMKGLLEKGLITCSKGRPRICMAIEPSISLVALMNSMIVRLKGMVSEAIRVLGEISTKPRREPRPNIWRLR